MILRASGLLALLLLATPMPSNAESSVEAMVRDYNDGETHVISPHTRVQASVAKDSVEIGAGYAMDIVTSSSCDVRSWSSTGRISDTRKEESADVTFNLQDGSVTGGFIKSDENDYHSQTYTFGTTRDFFQKNTTFDLAVSLGVDHVGHTRDPGLDRPLTQYGLTIGITQVLSPVSIAQLLYDAKFENGYLSGQYRVARLTQADGTVIGIPENSPNARNRHTIALKYNYFSRDWWTSFSTTGRFYIDNWDVKSLTFEERVSKEYNKRFSMTFNARAYYQTAASFYQDKYDPANLPVFFTGNKTLATYYTALAGLRPTFRFGKSWEAYAKIEYYIENFTNFTDVGDPMNAADDKLYSLKALIYGFGLSGKF